MVRTRPLTKRFSEAQLDNEADLGVVQNEAAAWHGQKERGCSVLYMGNGVARSDCLFCKQENRWVRTPYSPPLNLSETARVVANVVWWHGKIKAHSANFNCFALASDIAGLFSVLSSSRERKNI